MKSTTHLKCVTVTQEQWNNDWSIAKGFVIVDSVWHDELVTVIYQTQFAITEINLSQMSKKKLIELCKSENISISKQQVSQIPLTKTEILEMMDKELRDAEWESRSKYWEVAEKWNFVKYNIDDLAKNHKWRKEVFVKRGLPFFKTGYKKSVMTKMQLISSLLESSRLVYEYYGHYIA